MAQTEALEGLDNAVGLNCCTAQVACLLGKRKSGKRALRRAEAALTQAASSQGRFDTLRRKELGRELESTRNSLEDEDAFDLVGGFTRTFVFPVRRGHSDSTSVPVFAA